MIYSFMYKFLCLFFGILLCINHSYALVISEIYPKPTTPKTNKEWIEIFNNSENSININGYKFFEGNTHHSISTTTAEDNLILNSGEYAVIVQDRKTFLDSEPGKNCTGKIFRSAGFTLDDNFETLILKDKTNGNILDSVVYNSSNLKDGESINFVGSGYVSGASSPCSGNLSINVTNSNSTVMETSVSTSTSMTTENFVMPTYYYRDYWPESEKIYVNAGENKIGILGAEIAFEGKTIAGDKKQVNNATYFWSFGDGEIGEGKNIFHVYKNIGEYVVFVEAYANGYKSDNKVYVKVVEPNLKINLQEKDGKKSVEISNNSKDEIDVGRFLIKSFGGEFEYTSTLPKKLLILPGKSVNIFQETLKFATSTNKIIFASQNGKEVSKSEITFKTLTNINENNFSNLATSSQAISVMTKEEFEKKENAKSDNIKYSSNSKAKILNRKFLRNKFVKKENTVNQKEENVEKFTIRDDKTLFTKVLEYFGI